MTKKRERTKTRLHNYQNHKIRVTRLHKGPRMSEMDEYCVDKVSFYQLNLLRLEVVMTL